MTVRVNKSSFNIREKLSELGRKFGLKGSELAAAETVQEARDLVSAGRKNLLINGDHNVDQRNGGSAITPTHNQKITDRWRCELAQSSKYTAQQSGTAPDGFRKSLKITSSSAYNPGASDYFLITQDIEGYTASRAAFGTSSAKPVTLSFWVRSSLTGTFACSIRNKAFNRTHIKEYTISSADTWEYKILTFPGITDGTWETGSNQGIRVNWSLGAGTDFHGAADTTLNTNDYATAASTNVVSTNGATWYMTGAQFEIGRNGTEFEHRSYGEELALCQRYFHGWNATSSTLRAETGIKVYDFEGNGSANQTTTIGTGSAVDADDARIEFSLPVTMRTKPTPTGGDLRLITGSTIHNSSTTIQYNNSTIHSCSMMIDNGGGMTAGQCVHLIIKGNGYFYLDAEF